MDKKMGKKGGDIMKMMAPKGGGKKDGKRMGARK